MCVCVCVCARACQCVCVCVCARTRARANRIVSRDKILHLTNIFIIIISNASCISIAARLKGWQLSGSGKVQDVDLPLAFTRQFRQQRAAASTFSQTDPSDCMMLERSTSTMPPTLFVCQRLYGLRAMLYCVIWSFRYSVSQPDGHVVLCKLVVSVFSLSA